MSEISSAVIKIPAGKSMLEGELTLPVGCAALVIFSHGSGSGRFSSRNNFVARELNMHKIGTFLFDLLTKEEDELYSNRFNIKLLTERLILVTNHIRSLPQCHTLKTGYFGASTGAASALYATTKLPGIIGAVVSRGGRPDLAIEVIPKIKSPTLLIVGEKDYSVLELNRNAYQLLTCEKRLDVISGATHLFEEPGTLNEVAKLAAGWFNYQLEQKETVTG